MAVYVDDAYIPASVSNGPQTHTSQWCHLTADSTEELLAFAKLIGLRRTWIQHPATPTEHFDLTLGKRNQAVAAGAIEITSGEAAAQVQAKATNAAFSLNALRAGEAPEHSAVEPHTSGTAGSWHTLPLW